MAIWIDIILKLKYDGNVGIFSSVPKSAKNLTYMRREFNTTYAIYRLWSRLTFLATKREFAGSRLRWISMSGLAWSLYKCAALWRAVYDLSAPKRRLGTIREEKGISSQFRVFYLVAIGPKLLKATKKLLPSFLLII